MIGPGAPAYVPQDSIPMAINVIRILEHYIANLDHSKDDDYIREIDARVVHWIAAVHDIYANYGSKDVHKLYELSCQFVILAERHVRGERAQRYALIGSRERVAELSAEIAILKESLIAYDRQNKALAASLKQALAQVEAKDAQLESAAKLSQSFSDQLRMVKAQLLQAESLAPQVGKMALESHGETSETEALDLVEKLQKTVSQQSILIKSQEAEIQAKARILAETEEKLRTLQASIRLESAQRVALQNVSQVVEDNEYLEEQQEQKENEAFESMQDLELSRFYPS